MSKRVFQLQPRFPLPLLPPQKQGGGGGFNWQYLAFFFLSSPFFYERKGKRQVKEVGRERLTGLDV